MDSSVKSDQPKAETPQSDSSESDRPPQNPEVTEDTQNPKSASQPPNLSIVVPLLDEAESIEALHEQLQAALKQLNRSYEIIFVNDGSRDATRNIIEKLATTHDEVIAISLRRNFGQTAAMSAGFDMAQGEILIPLDGDLQNDPADIARVLEKLDEGYDVVSGWRKDRQDPFFRVFLSRVANKIVAAVSGVALHDFGCSLKAYRREVLKEVHLYGEMHRFIPIYVSWQGAKVTEIEVTHHPRQHGESHYGSGRTLKVILDLLVMKFFASYLTRPIHLFGGFGLMAILLSLMSFCAAVFFKLMPVANSWGPGWHKDFISTPLPLLSVGLFVIGIQMILIGILAEILMRTYYESQDKRIYLIDKVIRRANP